MSGQRRKRRLSTAALFKRPGGRPPKIPDDPENIVRVLMQTPPAEITKNGSEDV